MTARRVGGHPHRAVLALVLGLLAVVAPPRAAAAPPSAWFSAWSRPQSVVTGEAADPLGGGRLPGPLLDQTVRDVVRVSGSGTALRVRLSNRYGASLTPTGTTPLRVEAVTVGLRSSGAAVVPGSLRRITFGRADAVSVPPGATVVSDPVSLPVRSQQDLAVSIAIASVPIAPQHGASFVTSYVAPHGSGDHTTDIGGGAFTQITRSTLVLTGIDLRTTGPHGVVAATGGSVVDGFGTQPDSHTDWPAWLSRRTDHLSVVNNGLGGTTAASACALPGTGPAVEERVSHDSLALPGIRTLIVYAGTNDLGDGCTAEPIIAAFEHIAALAHARRVRVLISTITPRGSYTAVQNAARLQVNSWVRRGRDCSGHCDVSLDFDRVVRDPAQANRIAPALDSGDGVHPNAEGYRRIAESIALQEL